MGKKRVAPFSRECWCDFGLFLLDAIVTRTRCWATRSHVLHVRMRASVYVSRRARILEESIMRQRNEFIVGPSRKFSKRYATIRKIETIEFHSNVVSVFVISMIVDFDEISGEDVTTLSDANHLLKSFRNENNCWQLITGCHLRLDVNN